MQNEGTAPAENVSLIQKMRWAACLALCVVSILSRCQEGLAQQQAKKDTAACDSRVLQKLYS